VALAYFFALASLCANGSPREVAFRLHNRLAGVPPPGPTLDRLADQIGSGDFKGAAKEVMATEQFLAITIKNWVTKWSNSDFKPDRPLNDMVATIIGVVRDDRDFRDIFYKPLVYAGNKPGLTPPSPRDNNHYEQFENQGLSYLTDLAVAEQQGQITAGIFTTRAFALANYDAGTNRRPIKAIMQNFMCKDMEQVLDVSRPDTHVRRDVERQPGGDATLYLNRCKGCHSGMDPMSRAFSFLDFTNNQLVFSPGAVPAKMNRSPQTFPEGAAVVDDGWEVIWHQGQNAPLGFPTTQLKGSGPQEFGRMLAEVKAVPECLAKQVFEIVCQREPKSTADLTALEQVREGFVTDGFVVKDLFAATAAYCLAEQQ
jgi:hypothetical protein